MVRPVRRAAAILALCLVALAGCQKSAKKVIAVVPKGTSHLFWMAVQAGALAAGEEYDVQIEWNGPASETEYPRQIQIVESFISRRVDGIALAAAERRALIGVVDRAAAAGIPVTIFDSGIDSENYVTFLATNNYEAGQLAGRTLGRLLNGNGTVGIVMHAPGSASTMDRERGFEDAIKAEFPGIRIVAQQYGQSDRAKAMAATENILTANPDLDGLFASSEPSSAGAALALKSRNLSRIQLVAFDSSESMIEDLKTGVIDAMVVQDPFRMGHDAVKTVVDTLNGHSSPKRIDLSARVVTKADLEREEIKRLLFPDVKKYVKQ
jgi:ribose transport system substrate-binding protein